MYNEICVNIASEGWTKVSDPSGGRMGPFAYKGNQWVSYDDVDTVTRKAQYIQEVLLNMVRAASNLLSLANRAAWEDLATSRQVKAASALMQVLEENAFLFAETTEQEEVLVESSKNICKYSLHNLIPSSVPRKL